MEWYHHTVTQEFLSELKDSLQATMEAWASWHYVGDTAEKSTQMNAEALGGVDLLRKVIAKVEDCKSLPPQEEKGAFHDHSSY